MSQESFYGRIDHGIACLQQRLVITKNPAKKEEMRLSLGRLRGLNPVYRKAASTGSTSQGSKQMAGGIR